MTPDPIECYHCHQLTRDGRTGHAPNCPVPALIALATGDPPRPWRGYDHNGECLDCDEPRGAPHADDCTAAAVLDELRALIEVASWAGLLDLLNDLADADGCRCRTCGHGAVMHGAGGDCRACGLAGCWT